MKLPTSVVASLKVVLLLGALAASMVTLAIAPAKLDARVRALYHQEQGALAHQAASRLESQLAAVSARLSDPLLQSATGLTTAEDSEALRGALMRWSRPGDEQLGVRFFLRDASGEILAGDPRLGEAHERFSEHQHLVEHPPGDSHGVCPKCFQAMDAISVEVPLDDGRLFGANLNSDRLAADVLRTVVDREGAAWLMDAGGAVLAQRGQGAPVSSDDDRWVSSSWSVGSSSVPWRLQLAAPAHLVAREVEQEARSLVLGAMLGTFCLLVLAALLWWDHRRRLAWGVARVQTLAHQEKLITLGTLSASTAHEIGNALTVVETNLLLLDDARDDEDRDEMLADAALGVSRLREITESLRNFARRSSEEGVATVSLAVAEALSVLKPRLRVGPEVEVEVPADLGVCASRAQLVQVLVNLIQNAADALECGPERGRIRISATAGERAVEILVDDDGPGVPEARRSSLFEPFFTTKASGKGTGLGLWLSRSLLNQSGGRLDVGASPLGGARFTLRLRPSAESEPSPSPIDKGRVPTAEPSDTAAVLA